MSQQLIADALITIAGPFFMWLAGYVVMLMRKAQINDVVLTAIANGAGAAYASLAKGQNGITDQSWAQAVRIGTEYVMSRIPQTLPKAGFNDAAAVAQAVDAHLGKLAAADPNISPVATVLTSLPAFKAYGEPA